MNTSPKRKTLSFAMLLASFSTLLSVPVQAQEVELIDLATVQPIVIDNGSAKVINYNEQLTLMAEPTKSSYKVNEPIRFNLTTNQSAYVYILSTEPSGRTVMVYPNQVDKDNLLQANMKKIVPSANAFNAPLYSDRAGQEAFTIIASTKPLDITDLFHVVNSGHLTAATDDVQSILADYGIDIGSNGSTTDPDIALRKINLNIINGLINVESPKSIIARAMPSVVAKTRYGNTLILSTDKNKYQSKEAVMVTYAATGRNYINLGVRLQDGSIKTLKTQKSGNKLKKLRFYMPEQMDSVMLWESESRFTKTFPRADESIYLNLKSN